MVDPLLEFVPYKLSELPDDPTRLEALLALTRNGSLAANHRFAALLRDRDPVIAHTAVRAAAKLGAVETCLDILASAGNASRGAALALARMHEAQTVDGLIAQLDVWTDGD